MSGQKGHDLFLNDLVCKRTQQHNYFTQPNCRILIATTTLMQLRATYIMHATKNKCNYHCERVHPHQKTSLSKTSGPLLGFHIGSIFTGKITPVGKVREIFRGQGCCQAAINALFTLSNVHSIDFFLQISRQFQDKETSLKLLSSSPIQFFLA